MKLIFAIIGLIILIGLGATFLVPDREKNSDLLPDSYVEGRERFLKAAKEASATLHELPIAAKGPNGEALTIDIAWLGVKQPKEVLLHLSGTHGVEAFAGSLIQEKILASKPEVPEGDALLFVHAVNPYGMANLRRFNESNVDLNRNFHLSPSGFSGAPEAYRLAESFLNPDGAPNAFDPGFYAQALVLVVRHGFATMKQAIAGGQYEFPEGLYYGGAKMEESLEKLSSFLVTHLRAAERLVAIEVHTGLGEYGKDVLFSPLPLSDPKVVAFQEATGEELESDAPDEGVGFVTPGDIQAGMPQLLPGVDIMWILQEFGAYGPIATLRALRDENRYYQAGGRDVSHWSKLKLKETFTPPYKDWEEMVLARGEELFAHGCQLLNGP